MIFKSVKFGKFLQFSKMENWKIYRFFFQFGKSKFHSKNCQILKLFAHSIFRTARDFGNSHICLLIKINFDALTSEFLFPISVTRNFTYHILHLNVR